MYVRMYIRMYVCMYVCMYVGSTPPPAPYKTTPTFTLVLSGESNTNTLLTTPLESI